MIDGPYFEDLHVGRCFDSAPAVTLTEGLAAAHQAIVGGRVAGGTEPADLLDWRFVVALA